MRRRIPELEWQIFLYNYYRAAHVSEGLSLGKVFIANFDLGRDDPEINSNRPDHEIIDHIREHYVIIEDQPNGLEEINAEWPVYEEALGG